MAQMEAGGHLGSSRDPPYQRWSRRTSSPEITWPRSRSPRMGYTKIAGMPVITGLYTILIPIAGVRAPRLVEASRGRRRLGDRGDHVRRDRGPRASPGSQPAAAVGRPREPLGAARRGACSSLARHRAPRLPRRLPLAHRARRLPHGRRHPGRDGPGRRACSAFPRRTSTADASAARYAGSGDTLGTSTGVGQRRSISPRCSQS